MALTKGWPEPTDPEWSTVEERREGEEKEEMTEPPPKKHQRTARTKTRKKSRR